MGGQFMRETSEQKRWRLVLDDAESPELLKAEARRALGIAPESTPHILEYSPQMDSLVEFYWHRQKSELEERNPTAEKIYSLLVDYLVLGGGDSFPVEEDSETLLSVLGVCRSDWMRRRATRALLTIRVLDGAKLSPQTRQNIDDALNSSDSDMLKPAANELDWLGLLHKYSPQAETEDTRQPIRRT
jgi:hypothetical protein